MQGDSLQGKFLNMFTFPTIGLFNYQGNKVFSFFFFDVQLEVQ